MVVAALQREQAERSGDRRGIHAIPVRAIERERRPVARIRLRVVAFEAREVPEIDQIRRRWLVASGGAVRRECAVERAARPVQVAELSRDEPQIVPVRRRAARVASARSDVRRAFVEIGRPSERATVGLDLGEGSDCVPHGPPVADRLRDLAGASQVMVGAVQLVRTGSIRRQCSRARLPCQQNRRSLRCADNSRATHGTPRRGRCARALGCLLRGGCPLMP